MKITEHTGGLNNAGKETSPEWVEFFSEARRLVALARTRRAAGQRVNRDSEVEQGK